MDTPDPGRLHTQVSPAERARFYQVVAGWVAGDFVVYAEARDLALMRHGYIYLRAWDSNHESPIGKYMEPTALGMIREYYMAKKVQ